MRDAKVSYALCAKKELRETLRSFAFYLIGVFLFLSAFVAIFNLQSSINIENGLGTTALGISYFISVFFAIFGAPVMINKYGAKRCVVVGDTAMFIFLLANFYPTYYTLLPAGILMTVLQSPQFPSLSLMNTLYAKQVANLGKKSEDVYIISFSGYFFTAFQASQVFGNILSYVILYGFDQSENANYSNMSLGNISEVDYSICGSADCQNETIVSENILNYKPVNKISLYVLISIALLLELTATLVHAFLLPNEDDFKNKSLQISQWKIKETSPIDGSHEDENVIMGEIMEKKDDINGDMDKICETKSCIDHEEETAFLGLTEKKTERTTTGICDVAVNTAQSLIKHVADKTFLLLIPITLYNGLLMAFVFSELTRAYTSCSLGVQWVGICMAIYGLSDAVLSWMVGKYGRKFGRIQCYLFALIIECGNYIYCIFWTVGSHTLISIFALFFMFGFSDGIFQTIINVTHLDFAEDKKSASSAWNVLIVIGNALGFITSTVFCVRTRIYINLGFLIVGFVLLVISDIIHRNRKKMNSECR
uniref:protein unc-93 homolog A-like n=1 Tax=Styela clava TaxID=7725 RepID=UPI00193A030A|nr:protein unc-93 homolog A-like [Styela clava]